MKRPRLLSVATSTVLNSALLIFGLANQYFAAKRWSRFDCDIYISLVDKARHVDHSVQLW